MVKQTYQEGLNFYSDESSCYVQIDLSEIPSFNQIQLLKQIKEIKAKTSKASWNAVSRVPLFARLTVVIQIGHLVGTHQFPMS